MCGSASLMILTTRSLKNKNPLDDGRLDCNEGCALRESELDDNCAMGSLLLFSITGRAGFSGVNELDSCLVSGCCG